VGNGVDDVAQSSPGVLIGSSAGTFQSISGFTGESDSVYGANYYTLQDNTNFFTTSTPYTGGKSILGWEQFVFANYPVDGSGFAFIQYWLINYESTYGSCPSVGPPGGTGWTLYSGSCYANGPAATVPLEAASNLGSLTLAGYANLNSDDTSYLCVTGGGCYGVGLTSQVVDLYQNWQDAEFNIFGAGGGSQANFNAGTSMTVVNTLNVTPSCVVNGYTAETNNLNLGPCSSNSTQILFSESNLANPTITTALSPPSVSAGGIVHDTAALSGVTSNAGGTVTYYWFSTGLEGSCSGQSVSDQVTVSGGVVPNSVSYGPLGAGSYSWQAVYSGDSNNKGATSACESLVVGPLSPSLGTTLSASTIAAGGSASDSGTLSGGFSPAGTVTFFESTTDACPAAGATQVGTAVTVSGNGVYQSVSATFSIAGTYYWYATYSGDSNNNQVTSPCEPLSVTSSTVAGSIRLSVAESGAPAATFGLSGCSVSVSSVVGDGSAYPFTATPDCPITVTAPSSAGAGSRYLFAGASPTESFTTCASGTCSEQDYAYFYQLSQSVVISVTGGGIPSISLTSIQFGASTPTTLTISPTSVWIDYATTASVPSAVAGATGEQWVTTTASWSITSSDAITNPIAYQHQYQVTFAGSPAAGGTTTPSGTDVWEDAGSLPISAAPNAGYSFSSWSATESISFSDPSSASTTATVSGPGTITADFTAAMAATSTSSTPAQGAVAIGATITFTATVTDNSQSPTVPTGTVAWSDGGAGGSFSPAACALTTASSSSGSCSTTYTPPSTAEAVTITGTYSGDSSHLTSSGTSALTVETRSTSASVSPSPTTVTAGSVTTFTVTVKDTAGGTKTTPTGTVSWSDGGAGGTFGSSGVCTLTSSATCSVTYTAPSAAGPVTIAGSYSGDATHSGSSGESSFSVVRTTTAVVSPGKPSAIVGDFSPITFTSTITDTSHGAASAPSGAVSWSDGGKGGSFSPTTCTLSPASSDSSKCKATYTPSSSASAGSVKITAAYAGDASHSKSSASATLTISKRTTGTTVSPGSASVGQGTTTPLTVTVTDKSLGTPGAPKGTVTWTASVSGGSFTSTTCTLSAISSTQSQCSVTYTAPSKAGAVTITAKYGGDSAHLTSSGTSKLTVT